MRPTLAICICTTPAALTALSLTPATDPGLLGGPTVQRAAAPTLVRRDDQGAFVPVAGRPEAEAIKHIQLEDGQAERLAAILDDRRVNLAAAMLAEHETLRRAARLRDEGEPDRADRLIIAFRARVDETAVRDPVVDDFAAVLTTLQQEAADRLLSEYWEAWIDWELRDAGRRAAAPRTRALALDRLTLATFRSELAEIERTPLGWYGLTLDAILEHVDPTPGQTSAITGHLVEHMRTHRLALTPQIQQSAMLAVYRELDPQRRERLFVHVLGTTFRNPAP